MSKLDIMPKAKTLSGYSLAELSQLANFHPRTIRRCIEQGLIAPPEPRGRATRYSEEHLVRLRAISYLRYVERVPFSALRRRLTNLASDELRQLASRTLAATQAPPPPPAPRGDSWRRVTLAPGLELHLRDDAPAAARDLAARIERECGATP
jgi:DNA-binding transcriptional MerR regulator